MRNTIYWILGAASLALLLEGPRGQLLTTTPQPAKVSRAPSGQTVRGGGPLFVYMGGGYHGGK